MVTGTDRLYQGNRFYPGKEYGASRRKNSFKTGEKTGGFVLKEAIKLVANNKEGLP